MWQILYMPVFSMLKQVTAFFWCCFADAKLCKVSGQRLCLSLTISGHTNQLVSVVHQQSKKKKKKARYKLRTNRRWCTNISIPSSFLGRNSEVCFCSGSQNSLVELIFLCPQWESAWKCTLDRLPSRPCLTSQCFLETNPKQHTCFSNLGLRVGFQGNPNLRQ